MGGANFNFSQKIGLKTTKKVRFCILYKPMGGARAPPWLRYWSRARGPLIQIFNNLYAKPVKNLRVFS